jgi:hypothetical protein
VSCHICGPCERAAGSVVSLGFARQAHPGSIPTGVTPRCRTKKNLLAVSHPLLGYDHCAPPSDLAVAEWAVWIRPISDGRPGFGDFLDRDLWFRDFLIKMLGGESSFPGRIFFLIFVDLNLVAFSLLLDTHLAIYCILMRTPVP